MTSETKRPNLIVSLALLLVVISVGAHISGIPFLLAKAGIAPVLFLAYGFFAVRLVSPLQIGSSGARAFVGLVIGAGTLYLTWAIRIPAFSGWETPFVADPALIYDAIIERASHMEISKGYGYGTSAEGPSWLMLGTYLVEAFFFVGVMVLCALMSGPEKSGSETASVPASD